jgi:fibronectin-binding autotransporter adhesin
MPARISACNKPGKYLDFWVNSCFSHQREAGGRSEFFCMGKRVVAVNRQRNHFSAIRGLLICALVLIAPAARAAVNNWITTGSGTWDTPGNWSLGTAPSISDSFDNITTAVTKTVTLTNTSGSALTISNLQVSASATFTNTLLVTTGGSGTPFRLFGTAFVGANGILDIYNSNFRVDSIGLGAGSPALRVDGTFLINGNGGQTTVTNGSIWVGNTLTQSNSTTLLAREIAVAQPPGQATFTMAGGTANLSSYLDIGTSNGAVGTVRLTGAALLLVTNASSPTTIGNFATGQLIMSNATWRANRVQIALNAGSQGTLTILGNFSTNVFSGGLYIGSAAGRTGTVWMSGNSLVVTNTDITLTNLATLVGVSGFGRMTQSNGTWQTSGVYVGLNPGSAGTLTVAGGIANLSQNLAVGMDANATGTVWVTGGQLTKTIYNGFGTAIGFSGVGQMTVSNGTWTAQGGNLMVGYDTGSQGTLTIAGGTNTVTDTGYDMEIGSFFNATGAVWVTGGRLVGTNDNTRIGQNGTGQMTVSNGTWLARGVFLGGNTTALGTLTVAGGTSDFSSDLGIGSSSGSTGTVWITGGEVDVTNSAAAATTIVGDFGIGVLTLSNGTLRTCNLVVGRSGGSGVVTVNGGALLVTNCSVIEIRKGTLTLNGGVLATTTLLVTNLNGIVVFNGGTLNSGGSSVINGQTFVIGSVSNPATMNLLGGTHTFANGLSIAASGTLTGSGVVAGSVTNAGAIRADGGTLVFSGPNTGTNITLTGAVTVTNGGAIVFTGTDFWTLGTAVAYGAGASGGAIISSNGGLARTLFLNHPVFRNNNSTLMVVGGNDLNYGQIGGDLTNTYVITGNGSLTGEFGGNNLAILNQGTIASQPGSALVLDPRDAFNLGGVQNKSNGTLVVANSGTFVIRRTDNAWNNAFAAFPTNSGTILMQGGILRGESTNTVTGANGAASRYVNGSTGLILGCGTIQNFATVLNNGTILANCTALTIGGTVTNNGFIIATNSNLSITGPVAGSGIFVTAGGVSPGTITFSSGTINPSVLFNTGGTFRVSGGTVTFSGGFTNVGGLVILPASTLILQSDLFIDGVTGSTGNVSVTNANLLVNGNTYVGFSSPGNQLSILSSGPGALVSNGFGFVGFNPGSSNNTVLISGPGARWLNNGDLIIGVSGRSNRVTIAAGGRVDSVNSVIGSNSTANANTVIVTGSNSVWNTTNLVIGVAGSDNLLSVSNSARVNVSGMFTVAAGDTTNRIQLVDGGTLNAATVSVGGTSAGHADFVVTNATTALSNLVVGISGNSTGIVTVSDGTLNASGDITLGELGSLKIGSGGSVNLPGSNSVISVNSTNSLTVQGDVQPVPVLDIPNGQIKIGVAFNGTMNLDGGIANCAEVIVGDTVLGTCRMSGGTMTVSSKLEVGNNAGSTGVVWVAGGTWESASLSTIGKNGLGQMTISNGVVTLARVALSASQNPGTLTVAGGFLFSTNVIVGSAANSTGTVWITGAELGITNASTVAQLIVGQAGVGGGGRGTVVLSNGVAVLDQLVATNGAKSIFSFVGGTLRVRNTIVANGAQFAVGDGTTPAALNLLGGSHSFANGLKVSANATLFGSGTVGGVVDNFGVIYADGGPLNFGTVNNHGIIVTNNMTFIQLINVGGQLLDAAADADGDGANNLSEAVAGTNPTNSASCFRILSVAREGNDVRVKWSTAGGRKYVLQVSTGVNASYSNNFTDLSQVISVQGAVESTTNSLDFGAANIPARYYRVRLVP